jgi:hypothetical protein
MTKLSVAKGIVENRTKVFETDHAGPADINATGGVRKYYKITIAGRTFNASAPLGKQIISGKKVVVVLDRSEAIMLYDFESGKSHGIVGPWIPILAGLVTTVFNIFMIPAFIEDTGTRNLSLLLSINGLLIIILIVSFSYFRKEQKAKKLLHDTIKDFN